MKPKFEIKETVLTRYGFSNGKSLELVILDIISSKKYNYIYFFDEISNGIAEEKLISLKDIKNSKLNNIMKY